MQAAPTERTAETVRPDTSRELVRFVPLARIRTSFVSLRRGRLGLTDPDPLADQPLRVVASGDGYEVVDGFKRLERWRRRAGVDSGRRRVRRPGRHELGLGRRTELGAAVALDRLEIDVRRGPVDALEAFREAIALDPEIDLEAWRFGPGVTTLFECAKAMASHTLRMTPSARETVQPSSRFSTRT